MCLKKRKNVPKNRPALLMVANFDSGVGFAWWLMESFWAKLSSHYQHRFRAILIYPSISTVPDVIKHSPLTIKEENFNDKGLYRVFKQCMFIRREKVRCIYFTDQSTYHWRYFLYRLFGVRRIIVHDHTPGLRKTAKGLKGSLKKWAHRIPLFSVDGAIGATEFVRQRLIRANGMPSNLCHVAPNGIPPLVAPLIIADLHQIFKIPPGRKILVMTGRAHRYKGVEFILRCMAQIRSVGYKELHFLFIGDGPDLNQFKSIARQLKLEHWCTFAGFRTDIPELLEGADIAVHSSNGEVGYSLSILEYMRAGLPVLVPDNPSVMSATVHETTGMIYPEGDLHAASAMVFRLLTDEGFRRRLSTNARKAAVRYNLHATHLALLDAFDKICGPSKHGSEK